MTNANMSLFDAIHSQRAIRHFSEQHVSDEAVETMLNAAICAPSGGNRQPWRFVMIRDVLPGMNAGASPYTYCISRRNFFSGK